LDEAKLKICPPEPKERTVPHAPVNSISPDQGSPDDTVLPVLSASIYRVRILLEGGKDEAIARDAAFDTCASSFIIRSDVLPDGTVISPCDSAPRLIDANNQPLSIKGVAIVHLRIGGLRISQEALVVQQLSVPLILGTSFIDQYVEAIYPEKRRIVLRDLSEIEILHSPVETLAVKLVCDYLLSPLAETAVRVTSRRGGLSEIRPAPMRSRKIHAANGIAELSVGQQFTIMVANFSPAPTFLRKGSVVAYATEVQRVLATGPETGKESHNWKETVDLNPDLPESIQKQALKVLDNHCNLWVGDTFGEIAGVQHRISTTGGPIRQHPYRSGLRRREAEQTEVNRMLEMGVIEESSSEWASPVVLVPKPDGSLRFCVDYRKLNAVTEKDVYPLPRIDDCLDSLGEAKVFSTLDANSGYWQIRVDPKDREKTSFICHAGTFQFRRMPFGLVNAPATFQRAMDVILSPVKWKSCLIYLDDVIVYSSSLEQHVKDLDVVLDLLGKAGASLRLEKCHFFQQKVKYLGHVVLPGKLQVDQSKTDTVKAAALPRTKTELRSFLGLCGVYRRFIPSYAKVAAPLTRMLRGDLPEPYNLNELQREAFEKLKQSIISPPVLALPRLTGELVLDTDSSDEQLGCCLQQRGEDGHLHPLGFWSRHLNAPEINYSATEKEALAVVWAIKRLRPYLEGEKFTVRTDHSALVWLFSVDGGNRRLVRWRLCLAEYDFVIKYRPGVQNQPADALSRIVGSGHDTSPVEDDIPCVVVQADEPNLEPISVEEFAAAQREDEFCRAVLDTETGSLSAACFNDSGLISRRDPRTDRSQICVPESLRGRVMSLTHHPKIASHPGGTRMYQNLRRDFFWPRMAVDIHEYVQGCSSCARKRLSTQRKTSHIKLFPPSEPFEFVAMDILGPLPETAQGNRFLLVIVDRFSKLTRTVPLRTTIATEVAKVFLFDWYCVYGPPVILLTDNGSQFISKFFQSVCKLLGVKQTFSTAYHPQTNGQCERFNRTVLNSISHYISDNQDNWDELSYVATYAFNTTVHSSTGHTPFELSLARKTPTPVLAQKAEYGMMSANLTKTAYRQKILAQCEEFGKAAKEQLSAAQQRYKKAYDAHVRVRNADIQVGDLVFVRTFVTEPGRSPKVEFPVSGPYTVIARDDKTFVVRTASGSQRVSADRVTKAPGPRDLPPEFQLEAELEAAREDVGSLDEMVVDRIVGHGVNEDGQYMVKIRWHGQDKSEDTWQESTEVPRHFVERYARKKKLQVSDVLGPVLNHEPAL
jgi:RNase H-like domain found in reverse transcriptase/Reverse transcriptase (RNA-dependent DNA polymerase)/Integrase zinc binding domain/Integrase core domain/Chromo (CHRromatin Organisation MOdifier) domain